MILYALTILVSAFLLFQVQPVIAKIILPWFGGSAAVWTVCLLFFQLVLLLGYLYAHAVVRYLKPRMQMIVHAALLIVSMAALPIYPGPQWKPSGTEDPTSGILILLAAKIGIPYFLLSTTGPLLQAWYARRFKGAMPYRLYALSNLGSMFALISYPFLFEPVFTTHEQALYWSIGYGIFIAICAFTAFRSGQTHELVEFAGAADEQTISLPAGIWILWLALPACASVLLLAVTNYISQNVAAIPLLWVLPLSLYLLSFILCFDGRGWLQYRRFPYLPLMAIFLGAAALANEAIGSMPIWRIVVIYALGLFFCCMVCHGELTRLKPPSRYLTQFYLMISAGGAIGGLLVGFIAPHVFNAYYELPLGLAATAIITLIALRSHPGPPWLADLLPPFRLIGAAAILGFAGFYAYRISGRIIAQSHRFMSLFSRAEPSETFDAHAIQFAILITAAIVLLVLRIDRKLSFRPYIIEIFVLLVTGYFAYETTQSTSGYRLMVRNFYGGLKVSDTGPASDLDSTRRLTHGTINHGEQFLYPLKRDLPTTYYGVNTGVGLAIHEKQKTGPIRVGVIGLGTGTIASYGRAGDYYRYYEINPLILRIATSEFTFLGDCKAKHEVAMGDARLSLEREAPENFDVLAVDAFSSDSIPVHLLTLEAMQLYFRHLKPDAILAVHISNRYLDLAPPLQGEVKKLGKTARVVDTNDDDANDVFGATWVLITSPPAGFGAETMKASTALEPTRTVRLWTDDYSNLFKILK